MSQIDGVFDNKRGRSDIDKYELLKEMSHRVNNEYAQVVSSISLRARKSCDGKVKAALADAIERLMRFADVHRALMYPGTGRPVEICGYLRHLCRVISCARLQDRNMRLLFVECEPQFLPAESCWKLGLVVSELITNSMKHAFGEHAGVICVQLEKGEDALRCRVLDNGQQRSASPPGQGLRLINSLVQGLGGTLDYSFTDRGGISVISLPSLGAIAEVNWLAAGGRVNIGPVSASDLPQGAFS